MFVQSIDYTLPTENLCMQPDWLVYLQFSKKQTTGYMYILVLTHDKIAVGGHIMV